MRARIAATSLALGLLVGLAVGAPVAARGANGNASCVGIELSAISPPGSSDEVPGGAREFARDVREIAAALGIPPGALVAFVAGLHAGSHEACDEAIG